MATAADRKRTERARMRAAGYVLRQMWVHPEDMAGEEQIEAIGLLRECLRALNVAPSFRYGSRTSYQLAAQIERYLNRAAQGQ